MTTVIDDSEKRILVVCHRDYVYLNVNQETGMVLIIQEGSSLEENSVEVPREELPALIKALEALVL